jgi:sarcosine oxidase subunit alpha
MRLAGGGRIDRSLSYGFTFNGTQYQGYAGDTLAAALIANGVRLIGRSFKLHRPRGIFSAGAEEPSAIVQVESGANTVPNLRATQVELYDGLSATSVNAWPSLAVDFLSINNLLAPLLPAGFYYKTFMWPKSMWHTYEKVIRRAAGLGRAPQQSDPDTYDHMHLHCDVLVVGGGPAGLAAALKAGRTGARVVLADEQSELGGQLLGNRQNIDGVSGAEWAAAAAQELSALDDVRVLTRTTAFGHYDHNHVAMIERRTDHLGPTVLGGEQREGGARQRIWKVRANQVIFATGAHERSIVFRNNDRPGVMLASAAACYVNRYAVRPGHCAAIFTNNDSAYAAAVDLVEGGVSVAAIIDARLDVGSDASKLAAAHGIEVIPGHAAVDVKGRRRVKAVNIVAIDEAGKVGASDTRSISCDLLAVSGGWNPCVHLHCHSGGKLNFDVEQGCFVPGKTKRAARAVGAAAGKFDLIGCLESGSEAGASAAQDAGIKRRGRVRKMPVAEMESMAPARPLFHVPSLKRGGDTKAFVDLQHDVTVSDISLAAREGYESVEHLKRYTTLGMATDQGKTSNVSGLAILSEALSRSIPEVGTTTFRPPYTPVTFGALAGRDVGALADPVRKTPMHHWHETAGAVFEDVGQWKRPWYYPRDGESMHEAVDRECLAARNAIGLLDASTLGKIDIQGPDSVTLLNRVYTNAWNALAVGCSRYGLMCGEDGMVFDDGVTTRLGEHHYLMSTTSGGAARVMSWLEEWLQTEWPELDVRLTSVTEQWASAGICGPGARRLMEELSEDIPLDAEALPFMRMCEGLVAGLPARIFRISFSGEVSFEVNVPSRYGMALWNILITAGEKYGITPYGTETLHVLRAEKGYIIVGEETDGTVTPIDLGMKHMVSKKKDFIGKRSLSRPDTSREDRKQLVGLLTEDETEVLPEGAQIVAKPRPMPPMEMIGHVTSSYHSANVGRSIALALIRSGHSRIGEQVFVPLPSKRVMARIVEPVFFDPEGTRLHG